MRDPCQCQPDTHPAARIPMRKADVFPKLLFSLALKELVYLLNECVRVGSVNYASILNGLTSRMRATEAMHTYFKKELCGFNVVVKNIADKRVFRYYHFNIPFKFYFR